MVVPSVREPFPVLLPKPAAVSLTGGRHIGIPYS